MADSQQPVLFAEDTEDNSAILNTVPTQERNTKRTKKPKEPQTSRQQLSSTIKSVRDLLRKEAGLAGDTDRLPQLTWLLFLKSIDDAERTPEVIYGDAFE